MLTPAQEKEVRLKIINSKIKFQEVYEELVDHYLNAVEERVQAGSTFEEALDSTHSSFGKQEGLLKLEKSYQKHAISKYKSLHWREFKERFRWPHITLILLVGFLSLYLVELTNPKYVIGGILLISVIIPVLIIVFASGARSEDILWGNQVFLPRTLRKQALTLQCNIAAGLFNVLFLGSKLLLTEQQWKESVYQLHPAFFASLLVFSFVWTWSFYLTVQNTKPQLTTN